VIIATRFRVRVRGYISAYDAETGKQLWRFYTCRQSRRCLQPAYLQAARAAGTVTSGSGARWHGVDGIVYDARLNLLFIGTGNGSPWNRQYRGDGGGDNLYIASIIAVNPTPANTSGTTRNAR